MASLFHCMPFYTYILQSETSGSLYIGQTNDLADRLKRHNNNENLSTKGRGPWLIIFAKEFISRSDAVRLERKLKSWKNKRRILEWIAKQSC